jgi:hypothetical protein
VAPESAGPAPDERNASRACWALFGELLARDYSDPAYRAVHQIVVDAYTAQHAGGASRREVQSVALCLMTLCLFVEDDVDPALGAALHKRMVAGRPDFVWLAPPLPSGWRTVADVLAARSAAEHCRLVRRWGREVWEAWAPHAATIRGWNAQALDESPPP